MQQVEQALRKVIEFHNFSNNEGFSCLIPDKEPFPSNEGLLLWFSSKSRIETKVQLFHSPARIRRMEEMLNLPEKEYTKLFLGYLENYLNSLREIGFENIGKGVDLFGKGKVFNAKASFELFEGNPETLKKFEQITMNNPIVRFAEDQGYFKCANKEKLVWEDFFGTPSAETPKPPRKESSAKRPAAKAKVKEKVKTKAKEIVKEIVKETTKAKVKPKAKPSEKAKAKTREKAGGALSLKDKLHKIAQKKPAAAVDDGQRKVWVKQLGDLYKKVQGWLSEYTKAGYLTLNFNKVTLSDESGNSYEVDSLVLDVVNHPPVVFQPVEMNVLGILGRVDLSLRDGKTPKMAIMLTSDIKNKPQWELWKGLMPSDQQMFDKARFEALLHEWIG